MLRGWASAIIRHAANTPNLNRRVGIEGFSSLCAIIQGLLTLALLR